jgi:hypothetical protein
MNFKFGGMSPCGIAAAVSIALTGGCVDSRPVPDTAPKQVQVTFNFASGGQPGVERNVQRGAVSGIPQHVGFYYSVNPDCTSSGLVRTTVKKSAQHGSVTFVNTDGYPSFPANSESHDCNKQKSPGVEVLYTSDKDFTGTDQTTVEGIGPKGKYMLTDYTVNVVAP